jgi:hypothetical protein
MPKLWDLLSSFGLPKDAAGLLGFNHLQHGEHTQLPLAYSSYTISPSLLETHAIGAVFGYFCFY